ASRKSERFIGELSYAAPPIALLNRLIPMLAFCKLNIVHGQDACTAADRADNNVPQASHTVFINIVTRSACARADAFITEGHIVSDLQGGRPGMFRRKGRVTAVT